MKRREAILAGAVVGSSVLAGCAGDADDDSDDTEPETDDSSDDDVGEDDSPDTDDSGDDTNDTDDSVDDDETGDDDDVADDETGDDDDVADDGTADEPDYGDLETYTFEGSGDTVENDIELEEGLIVLDATHDGDSNFAIHLIDDERDYLFVNEIGEYEGATADNLDWDEYDLEVQADGNWTVEIRQPYVNRGYDLPAEESGEINTVFGPYEFDGNHTVAAEHEGDDNFIVQAFPEVGNPELVVNEIGEYEGESNLRMDEPGYVAVEAGGDWSVEIE